MRKIAIYGFVGLVVPHLLRLCGGSDQRFLLPASALGGGALLLGARQLLHVINARRPSCDSLPSC